jgi:hypothetical protein
VTSGQYKYRYGLPVLYIHPTKVGREAHGQFYSSGYREFRNSTGTRNSAHKLTLYPIRMISPQDLSPPPRPSNPPRRLTEEWPLSRPPHPTGSGGSPPPPGPESRDFRYTRGNLCSETPAKQARVAPRHQKPEVNASPPTKRRVRERKVGLEMCQGSPV